MEPQLSFGRLIRVKGVIYVVAEPDPKAAIAIAQANICRDDDAIEDLGRITEILVNALNLKPGEMIRVDEPDAMPFLRHANYSTS